MFDDLLTAIFIFFTGLGSGAYVSIATGTVGVIIIPIMILLAGLSFYQVVGTSLAIDCIIGGVAGVIFLYRRRVKFKPIIYLGSTGVIFTLIGTRFAHLPSESFLTLAIGIVLIVLGINFVINGVRKNLDIFQNRFKFRFARKHEKTTLMLAGIIIGFISGIAGLGSSGIIAIILVLVYSYDLHTGIGTSLMGMFFIAGAGAFGHAVNNNISMEPLIFAGFGALIGAAFGSLYANKVNEDILGRVIGLIISILGAIMIYKVFFL